MFFRKPSDHVPHVTIFHTILRSMLWILFIEIALLVGILYLCRINTHLEQNAVDILQIQTENRQNYLQGQMLDAQDLSSLAGKVVLLDFWSAELGNSNVYNAELKETYRKYADAPTSFEVYQVAIDTSKPLWITAVQEQQLPWISVSDLRGRASTALTLYNVQKLPANFLIDRQGAIVARDIYGKSLEEKLDELTR